MHDNYGYFEEDHLGKFGDLSLWRRIVFLGRPYWLGALLAVLLSFVVVPHANRAMARTETRRP